jgi:ferredoxin-NADP reductase
MAAEYVARVDRIHEHGPTTRSLFLRVTNDGAFGFKAGQFISCLIPSTGHPLNRAYTIASAPGDDGLELLVDRVPFGPGSGHLFERRAGDTVRFTGPWGTFVLDAPDDARVVCIADRSGIAPIRSMLRARARRTPGAHAEVMYAPTVGVYRDELTAMPEVALEIVSPDHLTASVKRRWIDADEARDRHFWICGIGPIVHELRDMLRGAGYVRRAVRYEKW